MTLLDPLGEKPNPCECTDSCQVPTPDITNENVICSLPENEQKSRIIYFQQEFLPKAKRIVVLPDGRTWEFENNGDLRGKLEDLVTFERQCCPSLDWDISVDENTKRIRLSVTGLDPHSSFFKQLEETTIKPPENIHFNNAVKAGSIGLAVSLIVCCLVPFVLALVAGTAVALPLSSSLDNPIVIIGTAAAIGIAVWFFITRKTKTEGSKGCGPNC